MNTTTLITTIVSSSVIATILSSLINLYLKRIDFKNEYFKIVIKKRLEAYEWLEIQISQLKTSVLDDNDGLPYHRIFSLGKEYFYEFGDGIMIANSKNMWLNKKTNNKLSELLYIINQVPFEFDVNNEQELIKAGKKYYHEVYQIRDELEKLVRRDILKLYDFKDIKSKDSRPDKLQAIKINRGRNKT